MKYLDSFIILAVIIILLWIQGYLFNKYLKKKEHQERRGEQ